jgi:type I restriction enzyme S subunit
VYATDFLGNDPRFAYYFLSHLNLRRYDSGSAQASLNRNYIYPILIRVPDVPEQTKIASVLGALDDKIELNRRMNATLETMARALFQSWFVDFDPVRAKLNGRKPVGMDDETAALFSDSFQESELGHIPKGWETCSLASKIELLSGGTPKTSEPAYWNGDIPWYSVKDAPMETDVWVISTEKQVTALGIAKSAAQMLPEGATIISARGTVGKLALVSTPMAMNQSCYGVRGTNGYANFYTYFALRQATTELQQRTHGTVFDTITRQTFETLNCCFPSADLTIAFDRTVAPLLASVRTNLHQSRTLALLRDTLLPKLMSGDLRVNME